MVIIGIDNGTSGASVALSPHGKIIDMFPMPSGKLGKETIVDGAKVAAWMGKTIHGKPAIIVIEECPKHASRAATMRSMAMNFGIIYGAIACVLPHVKIVTVRSGNPLDSWQTIMLGRQSKGGNKPAALALASRTWPEETWLKNKQCRTPDTGLIDAALIAEFWRIRKS